MVLEVMLENGTPGGLKAPGDYFSAFPTGLFFSAAIFCFLRLFRLFMAFRALWHSGFPQVTARLAVRM